MKKWLVLPVLFLALQISAHAMLLNEYIDDTGNSAYKDVDGTTPSQYFGIGGHSLADIGGPAAGDNVADAFQFTITQTLDITHLSINATVEAANCTESVCNEKLPVTFQLFGGSTTIGLSSNPVPSDLLFSSHPTSFHSNGLNNKVYDDKYVPFDITLQPGTYWIADEITPPQLSGAEVNVESVDFKGTVATPEPSTIVLFGLGLFFGTILSFLTGRKSEECLSL